MQNKPELFYIGHRQRLREKFMDGKLTEYEQLELLLSYAIPRRDVKPLARRLLERFKNLYYVLGAPAENLRTVPGLGESSVILIKLVHSMIGLSYQRKLKEGSIYANQDALIDYCRNQMTSLTNEEFHVMYMDANRCLIKHEVHSQGTIESSNVYIDRILTYALTHGIKYIVLLHNHPTTDNSFSSQDVELTVRLEAILNACNIRLIDHFVVSSGIVHSIRAENLLNKSSTGR